jgi:hypothetical protein
MKNANKIAKKICFMDKTILDILEVHTIIQEWQEALNEIETLKKKLKKIENIAKEVNYENNY